MSTIRPRIFGKRSERPNAPLRGHNPHAHIASLRRVSEQSDGNKVDSGFRVGADIFNADAPGALERNVMFESVRALDGATHVFGRHVVEQDGFSAVDQCLLQFVEGSHFDLNRFRAAAVAQRPFQSWHDSSGQRDVIVFDEDSVGEIEAMILTAAAANRVFVDDAESRGGFACVKNARLRSGNRIHEFPRKRRDPAHALEKVQDHAFTGEKNARVVPDYSYRLAFVESHTVEDFGM